MLPKAIKPVIYIRPLQKIKLTTNRKSMWYQGLIITGPRFMDNSLHRSEISFSRWWKLFAMDVYILTDVERDSINRNDRFAREIFFNKVDEVRCLHVKNIATRYGIFQSQDSTNYCGLCVDRPISTRNDLRPSAWHLGWSYSNWWTGYGMARDASAIRHFHALFRYDCILLHRIQHHLQNDIYVVIYSDIQKNWPSSPIAWHDISVKIIDFRHRLILF